MSLQNLLKNNNYPIIINDLTSNEVSSDNVYTDNLYSKSSTYITLHSNLQTTSDGARSLGTLGHGFSDLYCQNLLGFNGNVYIVHALSGGSSASPAAVNIVSQGLLIEGSGQTVLTKYHEATGFVNLTGFTTTQSVSYSYTVVGKMVTFQFNFTPAQIVAGGSYITFPIPSEITPPNNILCLIDATQNSVSSASACIIKSNSTISIGYQADNSTFLAGSISGIYSRTVISYNLN